MVSIPKLVFPPRRQNQASNQFDPVGNTGSNNQNPQNSTLIPPYLTEIPRIEIGMDWLNITSSLPDEETCRELIDKIANLFDENGCVAYDYDKQWHCGQTYHHSARTPNGIRSGWTNLHAPTQSYRVLISIPGQACAHIFQTQIHDGLKALSKQYPLKFTRTDIAMDDYTKSLDFELVRQAINARNCTGFKPETAEFIESSKGRTIYMGSRSSDKFIRLYDKNLESKGEFNCYRWELVLKDYKANSFMEMYLSIPNDDPTFQAELLQQLFLSTALGQIDFIDRSTGGGRACRAERLGWFEEWLMMLGCPGLLKLKCRKRQSTIVSKIRWLEHQVETAIAQVRDVLGAVDFKEWINKRVESGRLRYTDFHAAQVRSHLVYNETRLKAFNAAFGAA